METDLPDTYTYTYTFADTYTVLFTLWKKKYTNLIDV